jgi:glycosyltransferase 2 family protein
MAILITIILFALLFTQISILDIISTFSSIHPLYLFVGFMLYSASYYFRTLRFHILLNYEVSIKDLFYIECIHNMMNNLLPARTGELSYIYFLKTEQNKTTGEGLATLVIARIFDFIIISIFFLLFFLFIKNLMTDFSILLEIGLLFLFFMVALLFGLLFYGNAFLKIIKKWAHYGNCKKYRIGDNIIKKSEETVECFEKFKTGNIRMYTSVIIVSIGIWILSYSLFYLIAISMGIHLELVQILFASSFAVFSTMLPIQGIAGFGTMEAGWALGFIAIGIPSEVAINTGFGFHLIFLFFTIILGIFGYVNIYLARKVKIVH